MTALAVPGSGLDRLKALHGKTLNGEARRRFSAFVSQAQQYYRAIVDFDPVAKPLPAYYFALNLSKALLTAVDPGAVTSDILRHGVSQRFERRSKYYLTQERIGVSAEGVFRLLAERTGMRHCYAAGHELRLVDLLAYLPEAYDLYADSQGEHPKLLPIQDVYPLFGDGRGWLRVEIDRGVLEQRGLGPQAVVKRCQIFGKCFRLVQSDQPTASYESLESFAYGRRRTGATPDLSALYDRTLIASYRSVAGPRRFIVVSPRTQLLSHEAVTFAVLHHLSSMVRYRPQDVERLRGTKYFWLFSSWVDRAAENFLLGMASRIGLEEHVVE